MVSLETFKLYSKFIKERAKTPGYDDIVREHVKNKQNKRMHDQCLQMVQSVWDINKYRNKVIRRLFDCALYEKALIVPLLQQCKEVYFIKYKLVVDEGECDISGECAANRICLTLQGRDYLLRSDIAEAVLYFHALTWYPLYLQSLYGKFEYIDEEEEYNLLLFMHNACNAQIVAITR